MSSAVPLLTRYADKHVLGPGDGITCPPELQAELTTNGFDVMDTVTDGQCDLHAFLIALTLARRQWPRLPQLTVCKKTCSNTPFAEQAGTLAADGCDMAHTKCPHSLMGGHDCEGLC